jgi:hypothetical protein
MYEFPWDEAREEERAHKKLKLIKMRKKQGKNVKVKR